MFLNFYSKPKINLLRHVWKNVHNSKKFGSKATNLKLNLRGIYPPLTTPFDSNEKVSYDDLKQNLMFYQSIPFRGYVLFGSTGEPVALSEEEKINILKLVRQTISQDKLVLCGTGCQSTKNTISFTQKVAENGADAALIITPSYYKTKMTDDSLYTYYSKVADNSPIPIILYNMTANTNIDMSPILISKLADHPNIIGLKESGTDIAKIGHVISLTQKKKFQVLAGSAGMLYSTLCLGCVGGILALANILGRELCALQDLVEKDHHKAARDLQLQLSGPNFSVTKLNGIAGVKAAMDKIGLYGGPTHSPLLPLSKTGVDALVKEFKANEFM